MNNTNSMSDMSSTPVSGRPTVAEIIYKIAKNLEETRFVQLKLREALNGENEVGKEVAGPSDPTGVMNTLAMLERRSLDNMQIAHDILSFFSDGGN